MPSRVLIVIRSDSNSATIASTLNSNLPTGSVGSCTYPPRLSFTARGGELGNDVAGIGERQREPVELGHDQDVAGAAGGHRLAQSVPVPVGPGQAVVDVDPVGCDVERGEGVALGGEVLIVGGDSGVPDLDVAATVFRLAPIIGAVHRNTLPGLSQLLSMAGGCRRERRWGFLQR
jgi:hypothetical protein